MLDIWVLDVGRGDSIVIRGENDDGSTAFGVIDSNHAGSGPPAALQLLRRLGAKQLSFVLLTHPHADHFTGLAAVLEEYRGRIDQFLSFPIGDFLTDRRDHLKALFKRLYESTDGSLRRGLTEFLKVLMIAHEDSHSGSMAWHQLNGWWNIVPAKGFDRVQFEVLLPLLKYKGEWFQLILDEKPEALFGDHPNTMSVALRLTVGSTAVVLGGDCDYEAWYDHRAMSLRQLNKRVDAVAVKIPHHGSKHDVTSDLLDYWYAGNGDRVAVISADGKRHPDPEVLEGLMAKSIAPYCTNLAKVCGGAKVESLFTAPDITAELRRVINSGEVELESRSRQPCQGTVCIHVSATGALSVTPQFAHPCSFRGDFKTLGL